METSENTSEASDPKFIDLFSTCLAVDLKIPAIATEMPPKTTRTKINSLFGARPKNDKGI